MTDERKKEFAAVAFNNKETANKYAAMSPEEVAADLKGKGYDFTVEEVKEIGNEIIEMKKKMEAGELSADELDNVAGGGYAFWAGVALGACCVAAFGW